MQQNGMAVTILLPAYIPVNDWSDQIITDTVTNHNSQKQPRVARHSNQHKKIS